MSKRAASKGRKQDQTPLAMGVATQQLILPLLVPRASIVSSMGSKLRS